MQHKQIVQMHAIQSHTREFKSQTLLDHLYTKPDLCASTNKKGPVTGPFPERRRLRI